MNIHLISFYTPGYIKSKERLKRSALANGVDLVLPFNRAWLNSQRKFRNKNRKILAHKRGAGLWVWKPYIIQEVLLRLSDQDVLFYSDAGIEILQPLDPLIGLCTANEGVVLFATHGKINQHWTKRDCFVYMGCDSEKYHTGDQAMGGFSVWMRTEKAIGLVQEWLEYCQNYAIMNDGPNSCGEENLPGFVQHRNDQSVLSLLAIRHNLELFRDPSQWGESWGASWQNSAYTTLINVHRSRKSRFVALGSSVQYVLDSLFVRSFLKSRKSKYSALPRS